MAAALGSLLERTDLKQTGLGFLGLLLIRAGKLRAVVQRSTKQQSTDAWADVKDIGDGSVQLRAFCQTDS